MPGRRWGKATVAGVTIDHLAVIYGQPDAILVDIEGAEVLAMAGASETIRRGTMFVIEIHVGCGLEDLGGQPSDVVQALRGCELFVSEGDVAVDWRPLAGSIETRAFLFAKPQSSAEQERLPARE
jgi:hypothetical protein